MKKLDIHEHDNLVYVTITVPRYQKGKTENGTNEKIKIDLPALQEMIANMSPPPDKIISIITGRCVKNNTLDNRSPETCSATWVFKNLTPDAPAAEVPVYTPPEAKPKPPKPKTTTRRKRTRKTTKKTDTEV